MSAANPSTTIRRLAQSAGDPSPRGIEGPGEPAAAPLYYSPKQLARRWCVSRSTADRIARDNGFTRFLPGHGRNGTVRYLAADVIRFEQSRTVTSAL